MIDSKTNISDQKIKAESISCENLHMFNIITDYFNFDENDIDLHKMKKCFDLFLKEFKMKKSDLQKIQEDFGGFMVFAQFEKNDMVKLNFPYLKNSLIEYINTLFLKYPSNNYYFMYYFFMLTLTNRNIFTKSICNFYRSIIQNNYFGISPKFSNVISRDVMMSDEYNKFTSNLAEWYTKTELIIFYTTILNVHLGTMLNFEEGKYSLENNFDFSIKTFAKKNFLKLASYVFKKSSLDINFGQINYNKLFFLIASSFTCGVSLKDIFGGDVKQLAFVIGGIFFNIVIGKLADRIDNYSNFVEFARLENIIMKLNKKLEKIHKKVYELLKLVLLSKVDYDYIHQRQMFGDSTNLKSNIYPGIEEKIEELFCIIKKYFEGVENIDEETEKKYIEECIKFEEECINNSVVDDKWIFINICKDK